MSSVPASRSLAAPPLADLIGGAPRDPGVYQFLDKGSKVLYVGKAKDLRARLRSYLNPESSGLGPRKQRLVAETKNVTWIVTKTELEAFVLEANLIKQYRPPFNVLLRDDKAYPYLRLTMNEAWPRLEVVRRFVRDGSLYFGPYVPAGGMRETLRFIRRTFPIRVCRKSLEKPERPCLQYQMGRCMGPCAGDVDRNGYLDLVQDVRAFLEGKAGTLLDRLRDRMWRASEDQEYERARELRDRIGAIEGAWEIQRAVSVGLKDLDVFGFGFKDADVAACVLFVRGGKIVGTRDWVLSPPAGSEPTEVQISLIAQFYSRDLNLPEEIILGERLGGIDHLSLWLSERKGKSVRVHVPQRGTRLALVRMAEENAYQAFSRKDGTGDSPAVQEIRALLGLERVPRTIHCFDISTHGGSESVGSKIVWIAGEGFSPEHFRRYRIREVQGMNDFAMMEEVLGRSYRDEEVPDLILVDGGKGQLESALRGLEHSGVHGPVAIAALAKEGSGRPERVFVPGKTRSIPLTEGRPGTLLLKRIRDEAHRFAVTYQRKRGRQRLFDSPLLEIPGIGPTRRKALLKAFGSIQSIRQASLEALKAVPGMTGTAAREVREALDRWQEGTSEPTRRGRRNPRLTRKSPG